MPSAIKKYEFLKYFCLVPGSIQISEVLLLNHFQRHKEQHNEYNLKIRKKLIVIVKLNSKLSTDSCNRVSCFMEEFPAYIILSYS